MTDAIEIATKLRRPGLLVRAAKIGASEYNRARELRRLIPGKGLPSPEKAVRILLSEESDLEAIRQTGDATYSVLRHVRIMIALMAEVRLAQRSAAGLM